MSGILPEPRGARPATPADLAAVTELVIAVDLAELGEPDWTETDQRADWARPRFDLSADTRVVPGPDGLLGYASVWPRVAGADYDLDVFLRPGAAETIEDALLAWGEARAGQSAAPGARVHVINLAGATARAELLARRGYAPVRRYYRMTLPLAGPRPDPADPPGLAVRPYRTGDDEKALYDVLHEAFADHHRATRPPYDEWRAQTVERPDHDPSLWFVATEGDEMVGGLLGLDFLDGIGWVRNLGVRPPWRGRGAGRALLERSFAEFARRGFRRVDLGVDAENETGATRLYESAGMTVLRRIDFHAKAVEPVR